MIDEREFARQLQIDPARLRFWLDSGWITPLLVDGEPVFRDIDAARGALIIDLEEQLGVNEHGIDVALGLLDQLYSMRAAFNMLITAMEVQPHGVRRHIVADAHKLTRLSHRRRPASDRPRQPG